MLNLYGENGFTFLLFQHLHETGQIVQPFLKNLRRFDTGQNFERLYRDSLDQKADPDVWLFPNFGKAHGFGEPDALILWNGFSFWVEVESGFNLRNRLSSARQALLQLVRFHYFNQAMIAGHQRRDLGNPHLAILGTTIDGEGRPRCGVLRIAGHPLREEIEGPLRAAAESERDHYILCSVGQMQAITTPSEDNRRMLHDKFDQLSAGIHAGVERFAEGLLPSRPPAHAAIERCWYTYYEGDLKGRDGIDIARPQVRYINRKTH